MAKRIRYTIGGRLASPRKVKLASRAVGRGPRTVVKVVEKVVEIPMTCLETPHGVILVRGPATLVGDRLTY